MVIFYICFPGNTVFLGFNKVLVLFIEKKIYWQVDILYSKVTNYGKENKQ